MCGYNTITEVLQKGKKAIVVPRIKPGREQLIRAQSMANAGLIEMIHPEELNQDLLVKIIFNNLAVTQSSIGKVNNLEFSGLPQVANHLTELLFNSHNIERTLVLQPA
jgi:predicted glycosyltransferase